MKKTEQSKTNVVPIIIGIVTQFNLERGFGIALIGGHSRSYSISGKNGPRTVVAGNTVPFFNGTKVTKMPEIGDAIALTLDAEGKSVVCWGHAEDWRAAERLIVGRRQTLPARSAKFLERLRRGAMLRLAVQNGNGGGLPKQDRKPLRTVIYSSACTL